MTGDYYLRNKVPAETQIAADTCDDVSIATQASSRTKLPAWIVRRIRATFVQSVTTMGGAIDKWAPQQTSAVVNADAAGRSFGRTRPAFDAVCNGALADRLQQPAVDPIDLIVRGALARRSRSGAFSLSAGSAMTPACPPVFISGSCIHS